MRVPCLPRVVALATLVLATAPAAAGAPDVASRLRVDALELAQQARDATERASTLTGPSVTRYLRLAGTYSRMAAFKREAADLIEQGRRDAVDWTDHEVLERLRDRLESDARKAPPTVAAHRRPAGPDGAGHLLHAAERFEYRAQGLRRHARDAALDARTLKLELARVFDRLARAKREAARAVARGRPYDWTRHDRLDRRRRDLDHALRSLN